MKIWQLQSAKAHLSELVKNATLGEPQKITLRGKPAVIVLSVEQYASLKQTKPNFAKFLRLSPLLNMELNITRDKTSMRDIDL